MITQSDKNMLIASAFVALAFVALVFGTAWADARAQANETAPITESE